MPAGADPAHDPARISHHQGIVGDKVGDNRPRTHEGILPDGDAADDRAVGAQGHPSPNQRRTQILHTPDLAARVGNIGEHHGRATKDVVLERHPFIDADVVLDLHSAADTDVGSNHHVLANPTIFSDHRVLQNVGYVPNPGSLTDLDILIDKGRFVSEVIGLGLDRMRAGLLSLTG